MVHSCTCTERIWQSSSVIINPQTGNGAGRSLEWIKWVVEVVPGRKGPENMRILKRRVVEVRPMKHAACFFFFCFFFLFFFLFFFWSDQKQISLGLDRQRWVEILDTTRWAACEFVGGGGVRIVWLAYAFMICVSLLVSPRTEGRKK